ncbi:MAG: DNA-binding response regulator [Nitrospirae bacterium]|nr:DNA-binding response regulator [Nitrospirota bacterium]
MQHKRILIFDEYGFARVCSALLESAGYETDIVTTLDDLPSTLNYQKFGLIITSYPFSAPLLEEIKKRGISTIILSDDFDGNLVTLLKDFNNSHCMIKPLDYEKFRSLVRQVMSGELTTQGGCHFVV